MSRRYTTLLAAVLLFVLAGCALNPANYMNPWIGKPSSQLMLEWGPPQETTEDGAGGQILIYVKMYELPGKPGRVTLDPAGATYTPPKENVYTAKRMFYVRPDGTIYAWRAEGL